METTEYFEIMLNEFLLNAGVVGFLRMVKSEEIGYEGEDYIIDGQTLKIRKDYFTSHNWGEIYIRALINYLGDSTKYKRVLCKKEELDKLYISPDFEEKEWKRKADVIFKEFIDMLLKPSFISGYVILSSNVDQVCPSKEVIQDIKNESDYSRKKEKYDSIYELLLNEKVNRILNFKDILYDKMTMFYADNKGNGAAFFSHREIDPAQAYNDKFIGPVIEQFGSATGKNTNSCIECGIKYPSNLAAPITLFVDTSDDLGKKKSYYWNCNPDAYFCPICTFICSLAPLGFTFLGHDGIFINNNSSIDALYSFAQALDDQREGDETNSWYKLYNIFTSEKIRGIEYRNENIQVVTRVKNQEKYSLDLIDQNAIAILKRSVKDLELLKAISISTNRNKNNADYINIYQIVVGNIINKRSQYSIVTKLIQNSLDQGKGSTNYIYEILKIQIVQKGGEKMEDNIKRAYIAKKSGEELRKRLTQGLSENETDNKLRGFVYQLLNSVSLENREKFMELILRTYSSAGIPVPDIFFNCFHSIEEFKEIGFAFLLGLKSVEYEKGKGVEK